MPNEPRRAPPSRDGFTSALIHGPVGRFSTFLPGGFHAAAIEGQGSQPVNPAIPLQWSFTPCGPISPEGRDKTLPRPPVHPVLFQIGAFAIPSYGVAAAVGILLALALSHWTARTAGLESRLDSRHLWNILVLGVFSALVVSRLFLIVLNLSDLRHHPRWLLAIAIVHHPLLAAVGLLGAAVAAVVYLRWARLPALPVLDALTAPLAVATAFEQVGALLAGSGYGSDSTAPWAVTYSSEMAARWSGTPLGVALHPVQAYAALASVAIAALALLLARFLPARRPGDIAGPCLIAAGVALFLTENFRDWEGRGVLFHGYADAPQLAAIALVLVGGLVLTDFGRKPDATDEGAAHG